MKLLKDEKTGNCKNIQITNSNVQQFKCLEKSNSLKLI